MRQGQFSSWLTDFADQGYKTIQASYLDSLKSMIESKSDKKFATIEDALQSFCTRLNLALPDVKQVIAGGKEFNAVMAALGVRAFNTEEIDKLIGQGTPAEAIANQFGNTPEEKQVITEYVEGRAEKQRDESSQIARDMKLSDDLVKPTNSPGSQAVPKMSSIRNLSTKVAQVESYYADFSQSNTAVGPYRTREQAEQAIQLREHSEYTTELYPGQIRCTGTVIDSNELKIVEEQFQRQLMSPGVFNMAKGQI